METLRVSDGLCQQKNDDDEEKNCELRVACCACQAQFPSRNENTNTTRLATHSSTKKKNIHKEKYDGKTVVF